MTVTTTRQTIEGYDLVTLTAGNTSAAVDSFNPTVITLSLFDHRVDVAHGELDRLIAELTALRGVLTETSA